MESLNLSLAFSPCPNDTFIFDAMVHGKVDTEGLYFSPVLKDVEELNNSSLREAFDVTKLSFHALAHVLDKYALLNSGSALGNACGPILISKKKIDLPFVKNCKIAIPGKYTTANFLLNVAFPEHINKQIMVFSDIENAIINGQVDAGLIIHENRFTYEQKGLIKLLDLGEYWEKLTSCPIPLGGIAVRRNLPEPVKSKVDRVIRRSIEYAFANRLSSLEYIKSNAQEMEVEVMYKHIDLYVNKFSINLGIEGRKAIEKMFSLGREKEILPELTYDLFN